MITDHDREAADVFGALVLGPDDGVAISLHPAVGRAWHHQSCTACASIRSAVRRFVRQVLITTARPEVAIVVDGVTVETITRSFNYGGGQ